MTDDQRRMLTEFLGSHHVVICRDGKKRKYRSDYRTFLTWQDLGDCKDKLVEKGWWEEFINHIFSWKGYRFFNIGEIADKMEGLLRPTNEKGEAHFCRLCAEFLEGRK